jgi:NTE family protein
MNNLSKLVQEAGSKNLEQRVKIADNHDDIHYNNYLGRKIHPRHKRSRSVENVLVLQGGGSLGAFGCGAFKGLAKNGIKFDIVAGTSIGAVNAAIIAGSKSDDPVKDLEEFWIEVAESSYNFFPEAFFPFYDTDRGGFDIKRIPTAAINAAIFGVPKVFIPRMISPAQWMGVSVGHSIDDALAITPASWTYLYDHFPLGKTLEKYVDFSKLDPGHSKKDTRLIVTAVNVLTAEHLVFDSFKEKIGSKHILASSAYPNYGFHWIEVEKDVYAWDGALMNNTPLREVMEASPRNDKRIYIVENYPKSRSRLPQNRIEVSDRARDITFSDKTSYDIETSKKMTKMIELVEHIYDIFEKGLVDYSKFSAEEIAHIKNDYTEMVENMGAEILSVNRITRKELDNPYLLKNADFTPKTVRELINQGEENCIQHGKLI